MATIHQADIQRLYVAYFNRPADVAGLAYWDNVLQSGSGSLAGISAAFAGAAEYKANYANLSAAQIVNKIYVNLFGRNAETDGLNYWADLLSQGKLSIDTIVKNIADGAQTTDKTAFTNKVQAATAFTAALDMPFESDGYRGVAAAVAAQAYIAAVTTDSSLADALDPTYLNATVMAVVKAGTLDPVYFLGRQTDSIVGSTGADGFVAARAGGANTLQTGDMLTGGSGADSLQVEAVATGTPILAATSGVEAVRIHAMAGAAAAPSATPLKNLIDARNMAGVTSWESHRSSADVTIQEISILTTQSTKDVTVAMVETDAGNADMGVYFTPDSLRSAPHSSAMLRLQLMDDINAYTGVPLLQNPFTGFAFYLNGTLTKVQAPAIKAALSYEDLFAAVKAAVAATPGLANITVSLGAPFTLTDARGIVRTGTEIVLTSTKGDVIEIRGAESAWFADPALPAGVKPYNALSTLDDGSLGHAVSTVILDDVGRGGTGGDLVIGSTRDPGSLPAGYAYGVERFEIEVRDNSKLQTITSTSNALRDVVIKNGVTSNHVDADPTRVKDAGSLAVLGVATPVVAGTDSEALDKAGAQHNGFGFSDVRTIDASAMTGKISFDAEITLAAIAKYNGSPADTTHLFYSGGSNDDSIDITIHGSILASNAVFPQTGGSFSFTVNGGAGKDTIAITVNDGRMAGAASLAINAGAGDDTVTVTGVADSIVNLGEGNDLYYSPGTANDHVLTGGLGDDWMVLSTEVGETVATSSNTRIVYAAGEFGNDKVQNFSAGVSMGYDQFDLGALGGRSAGFAGAAISNADGAITVQLETGANDTLAEIAALYLDGATPTAHVFIAYNSANLGKVYTVVDSAAGVPVVTFVGSVDLINVGWDTLAAANFS